MKKTFLLFVLAIFSLVTKSQYYYNDIITTQQTNKQYKLLTNNNVRSVSAQSFEADGSQVQDFELNQQISGSTLTTISSYPSTGKSTSVSTYADGKITRSVDSSANVKNTTTYTYTGNLIASITTVSEDTFMNSASTQSHIWIYENEQPVKMLLVKDNADTTVVLFEKDEHGNIATEKWYRNNRNLENYFYYYNDKNQLTDIVRFNLKAQRLLPDYLFDYNEQGVLIKFTQVPQGSDDYLVWEYSYNANGLKQKESCFNKVHQPVGNIVYTYK